MIRSMERQMGLKEMCDNLLLVTLTGLVHHPRHHAPQLNLAAFTYFNPPIIRAVTDQHPLPALGDEPLHQELSINHRDHDVVGQRVDGLVHDQDISWVDPGIEHGFTLNPDEECGGRVLDEELVQVYGLVYVAICREWWTCGDWRGEEWGMSPC